MNHKYHLNSIFQYILLSLQITSSLYQSQNHIFIICLIFPLVFHLVGLQFPIFSHLSWSVVFQSLLLHITLSSCIIDLKFLLYFSTFVSHVYSALILLLKLSFIVVLFFYFSVTTCSYPTFVPYYHRFYTSSYPLISNCFQLIISLSKLTYYNVKSNQGKIFFYCCMFFFQQFPI
jgi:hypothetical protein